ncbi:MAG: signal peptide peptidase SppA [Desulfatiglans sp.]|nr:signal peptide peptidase SppA [Desulfatiglans sp.]
MAVKKHPILTALLIIIVVAFFLGATMFVVLKGFSPATNLSFGDKIGVIPISGAITESQAVTSQLVRFKKDKGIKAIILRINSPGGGVGPSQEIYREVRRTIKTKKVIASLGGVAASGGYYIAAAADQIVANPGTITGSIGVLMEFLWAEDLLKKIGIKLEVLKSGEFKDTGGPHRELTKRDKDLLNALIAEIRSQFVQAVAEGRDLSLEQVDQIADGRILSGSQAKELGLVDALGNFQDAVELSKEIVGIKGDVTLVYPEKSRSEIWDLILNKAFQTLEGRLKELTTQMEYRWNGLQGY